jgi:multiple sugar transport system ATP-binding protein
LATVTFDHVSKRYTGDVVAVNDLNLQIANGEFLVLVGPSGCGKTTALRCVAGLESISDGKLLIGDRVVNDVAPKDRDIAMVFQSYALYPHMSVYDNLAFGLKLRHMAKSEIESRVKQAGDILGLGPYLDRKPKALSGGQRQRVALGRAIVREPQVFLMDEPLSNLDAKLRVETRAEILRLHKRLGATILYVTHDQVEAMTMGDRIAVMKSGELQQVGTPQELYDHPANRFVAGFIGSPSMNFASVRAAGDGLKLGDVRLGLSGIIANTVSRRPVDSELTIGFRPEHLKLGSAPADALSIPSSIDVVEYLGDQQLLHAKTAGLDIVALVASENRVKPGDSVSFWVAPDKLHMFDPQSELALAS